jgi:acetyltransferase-like isoleucine patch superfamily enzyme
VFTESLGVRVAAIRGRSAGVRRTLIRPRSRLTIRHGGSLEVTGHLDLGPAWEAGRYYPSQLVIADGGVVRVTGRVKIYTDFRIWINEGASLNFRSGYTNYGLNLSCWREISIGDECAIGEGVTIRDSDEHSLSGSSRPSSAPIVIGDRVWIGSGATILRGVQIGDGAVVAAHAVVTKDVPAHCLVAGVPAKVVRTDVEWR